MRLVEFRRLLNGDNALRARFELDQGRVIKFMVQLECRFENNAGWVPVVRYDTAHGFAHCDRLHPYEAGTKIEMDTRDYNEALTIAMDDLVNNWHIYRGRYAKWFNQG
jgi:hypothetical protein